MNAGLRRILGTAACAAAALLPACAIGPKYVRPDADVPTAYKEGTAAAPAATISQAPPAPGWITAQPGDAVSRGSWWTVFGDGDLNALEDRVDGSNQNLRVALAQLRQARAAVDIAHASFFPTVTAGAAASQSLTSASIQYRGAAGHTLPDYALPVSASWEPDLWDRIGHSVDSAQADAQASLGDLESLRLGLHAELATDYFNLRGLDAEKQLLDQTIVAYQQALDLTNNRFKGGIASQSDVAQAQTQLEMTQAQEIDLGVLRAQYEHAIASLVGQPAPSFSIPARQAQWSAPPIPAGLPSELLQRRPDIAAAERRVAAANAQIGVAQAAFFPDLTLSGSAGLEASKFASLLSGPSLFWAIGPQLVGTLFDGGRRRATVDQARAGYDAGVAAYRQTVLSAFQEVEDNLAALRVLQQEAAKQGDATRSAETALQLAMNRYQTGIVGYLDAITAQGFALSNERAQVDIARRQADASVLL
ncbi:MAG TPA: efflux transporter outer membrane subunit, partial [Nevskia sp.]|nr:efflux transporter outer membrane subunit [Nevskia sp.]